MESESAVGSIMYCISSSDVEALPFFPQKCIILWHHLLNSKEDQIFQSMSWQVEVLCHRFSSTIHNVTFVLAKADPQGLASLSKVNKVTAFLAEDLVIATCRVAIQNSINLKSFS